MYETLQGQFSFSMRFLFLVVLFGVIAVIEWCYKREKAQRWREYLFVAATGSVGAALALGNDLLTSRLSFEYFRVFKGIENGETYLNEVVQPALQAGSFAGIFLGAGLLMGNSFLKKYPSLRYLRLFGFVCVPLGFSILGGLFLGGFYWVFEPAWVWSEVEGILASDDIPLFALVWGIHTGLYGGAVLGEILALAFLLRARRHLRS